MGAAASTGVEALKSATDADVKSAVDTLSDETKAKLAKALADAEAAAPKENGHHVIQGKINAAKPKWAELNGVGTKPAAGMSWPVALVADQDEGSAGEGGWCSFLRYGTITYNGDAGDKSYSIDLSGEQPLRTKRGDKAGRGAEYSALEVFSNRLITMDDRTGNVDEIVPGQASGGFAFAVQPLDDVEGAPIALRMGDGKKDKPLKAEWSTQKDGKCIVGSTGKERTDDDGNVVHEGEMWVKYLDPKNFEIEHVDWRPMYNMLRAAAQCPQGAGYMIHESGRWSDVHKKWFFLPRKHSREAYDEVKDTNKCNNLMMCAPDTAEPSGDSVLMQPYLESTSSDLRGCSDFLFVPGTADTHLFLLRTEETLEGVVSTYASVVDLQANILMAEALIASERKFEGMAWVGNFGPFPAAGPGPLKMMNETVACASEPTPQSAFVFIKPHACTPAVEALVKAKFGEVGVEILSTGEYDGKTIDDKKYIDQHYYAIASKATLLQPSELNIPKKKFSEAFGEEWDAVLAEGRVVNALDACARLEIDADQIDKAWAEAKAAKRLVKFGGGFYCGLLQVEGKPPLYSLNAFFMSMRSKFTKPDVKIQYFVVQFDASKLTWADFRAKVLGPTDPATAPADSLRGQINAKWKELGLAAAPNTGDNGVHASASPFEGLAEKLNWLGADAKGDAFGAQVLAGMPGDDEAKLKMLKAFTVDPQVVLPGGDGRKGSLFDQLEDLDLPAALARCTAIAAAQPAS